MIWKGVMLRDTNEKFSHMGPDYILQDPFYTYNLDTHPVANKVLEHPSYADSVVGVNDIRPSQSYYREKRSGKKKLAKVQ